MYTKIITMLDSFPIINKINIKQVIRIGVLILLDARWTLTFANN